MTDLEYNETLNCYLHKVAKPRMWSVHVQINRHFGHEFYSTSICVPFNRKKDAAMG